MCINDKNHTQGRGHGGMEEKKEEEASEVAKKRRCKKHDC
jgi:hypothetical protein